jgi:D-serine dehydratase
MVNDKVDTAEVVAQWIEKAGYKGDLSSLTAGIHDISESLQMVHEDYAPALSKLNPFERDESLTLIIELLLEMEHIKNHAEAAYEKLIEVRDFLANSSSA